MRENAGLLEKDASTLGPSPRHPSRTRAAQDYAKLMLHSGYPPFSPQRVALVFLFYEKIHDQKVGLQNTPLSR